MIKEIKFINNSINQHIEDLHMMYKHDEILIDIEYYNELYKALSEASSRIEHITQEFVHRMHKKR